MKHPLSLAIAALAALLTISAAASASTPSLNITPYRDAASIAAHSSETVTVKLAGKVNRFGIRDFHATVPAVDIHIAEYPQSKDLQIKSGPDGWWSLNVLKLKGKDAPMSFIFSKKGWITTKTNIINIGDADDTDMAIQFVDPALFKTVIKPRVADLLKTYDPNAKFTNALVVTVGKTWASMHDDRLPHGDPGATATLITGAAGPIYFDESVMPNPKYTKTSVDGGVAWLNVPTGTHTITAFKDGVQYTPVTFTVEPNAPSDKITLYVASPPDSVQGSNTSPPGEK